MSDEVKPAWLDSATPVVTYAQPSESGTVRVKFKGERWDISAENLPAALADGATEIVR